MHEGLIARRRRRVCKLATKSMNFARVRIPRGKTARTLNLTLFHDDSAVPIPTGEREDCRNDKMSLPYARIPRRERTKSWRKLRGNRKEEIMRESEAAKNNEEKKKQRRQVSLSAMNSEHYIFRRTIFCDM